MATLKDVARAAGVSAMTVSNVLNGTGRVSDAVRARVRRAAEQVGYAGPDPTAASLRRGSTGTVGIVLPLPLATAFGDPAITAFLQGVAHEFHPRETQMTILALPSASRPIGRDATARQRPVRKGPLAALERAVIDAALLYSVEEDHPGLVTLARRGLPVLAIDSPGGTAGPERFGAAWAGLVTIDDHGGASRAARHVIGLGHRRAVVLVDRLATQPRHGPASWQQALATTSSVIARRLAGYLEAWTAAGLPAASLTVLEAGRNEVEAGRAAVRPLLDTAHPPTAVLAVGDLLALGACRAARDRGLSVPADLSVVGFDNSPQATAADPPLTTVHQPAVDKGVRAARALLDHLAGSPAPAFPLHLPTSLVVRASTAAPREPAAHRPG